MKPFLMLLLSPFIFSSCLVVKIYESPKEIAQEPVAPKEVHHKMIGSGKVIDLGENGSHEIMFFGRKWNIWHWLGWNGYCLSPISPHDTYFPTF